MSALAGCVDDGGDVVFVLCTLGVICDVGGDELVVRVWWWARMMYMCIGATITKPVTVFVIARDVCT